MVLVRQNFSEFGMCAKVKKLFRQVLFPFLKDHKDPSLHERMMKMFPKIKNCDLVREREERTVWNGLLTDNGKQIFSDFRYTPERAVRDTFTGNISIDPETFDCTVSDIHIIYDQFPAQATHMGLLYGVVHLDAEKHHSEIFMAEKVILGKKFQENELNIPIKAMPEKGGLNLTYIGLKFYQKVSGDFMVLKAKNTYALELICFL
ncbi:hypothetical protein MQE36_14355 [Zhouia spongiae]|uniref:Uncharacterized protein n=1 Tax=Zhouia spongiae TaxID=2202721 RepID=A0ABY3YKX7_9FLAO|nr:hypothetical protein [Zhouia spongiae]UNY98260.1 hypothetical protein MQE36_14355 [Zhouia spongiae]